MRYLDTTFKRATLLFVIGATVGFAGLKVASAADLFNTKASPNILAEGHPEETESRAMALLSALQANNWSASAIGFDLLRVPDQSLAQNPNMRGNVSTFCIPDQPGRYPGVAFFTDLYVYMDRQVVPGQEATMTKNGFYMVGWKNMTVTRVPINDVRYIKTFEGGARAGYPVFPGMSTYASGVPLVDVFKD